MSDIPETNWIDRLPPHVRDEVRSVMTRRRFTAGQPIYHGGDTSDTIYQVVRGTVLFRELSEDGQETLYAAVGPGGCIGHTAILGVPRVGTATPTEETELDCLQRDDFERLRDLHPAIDRALVRWAIHHVLEAIRALHELKTHDLSRRLAYQILLLLRYAGPTPDGTERDTLAISQETLAASVGATRQGISRIIREWSAAGLVHCHYGHFRVLNVKRLRQVAQDPAV